MKTTTNHGFKKPDGTDIVNIEDINYNFDKVDGLIVPVSTTKNGVMTKQDKSKLDAIAPMANNYTHPANHEASMITGLANVAKTGSYNDLMDKPSKFTPSLHGHDWNEISGTPHSFPADGGNADTVDGKHASDFLSSDGGVVDGALKWGTMNGNVENGIEGGNADAATFSGCSIDLFSWNGIGFYPKAGGHWGNGKQGRSIVIDPRTGYIKARGGMEIQDRNVLAEIDNLKSSVVNGKQAVVNAINDRVGHNTGLTTNHTHDDYAWHIRNSIPRSGNNDLILSRFLAEINPVQSKYPYGHVRLNNDSHPINSELPLYLNKEDYPYVYMESYDRQWRIESGIFTHIETFYPVNSTRTHIELYRVDSNIVHLILGREGVSWTAYGPGVVAITQSTVNYACGLQ